MMDNISLQSLDLKNNKTSIQELSDFSPEMDPKEKRRYRNKLLFVWGLPVACGIFSFIYWFICVVLVWNTFPFQRWPVGYFVLYGIIVFAIWATVIALAVLWWKHKYDTIVKCSKDKKPFLMDGSSKDSSNDSGFRDGPSFPTKASIVQPAADVPDPSFKGHGDSSVCIPVQSDNTPSLYNSRTGRYSYDADYQLNSDSASLNFQEPDKKNSEVLVFKKMDSFKLDGNKKQHISSSDSEGSSTNLQKVSRDSEDGLEKRIVEDSNLQATTCQSEVDSPLPEDEPKDSPAPLTREESFKGLPEMNSFGNYLQLVTIETPLSPRDQFFSDLLPNRTPETSEVQMRAPRDRRSYCVGDLDAAQQRIAETRKSMPLFLYSSDVESGLDEPHPPSTPPPSVVEIIDESSKENIPQQIDLEEECNQSVEEGEKITSPVKLEPLFSTSSDSSNKKYFIANVLPTKSITSEVHLDIEDNLQRDDTSTPSIITTIQKGYEGRWILLSKDYAVNNLEAFIRLESEAMARETAEGTIGNDDVDNDSVFLETDQF